MLLDSEEVIAEQDCESQRERQTAILRKNLVGWRAWCWKSTRCALGAVLIYRTEDVVEMLIIEILF